MSKMGFVVPGKPGTFGISAAQMRKFRPHEYPMILLEEVNECSVGEKRLRGSKLVRADDPYVQAHFPGDPIMPPCFVIEGLAQACGCLMNVLYFDEHGLNFGECELEEFQSMDHLPYNALAESKVKVLGLAAIGETIILNARVLLQRKDACAFHVAASVGDRPLATGEMILAYPTYMPEGHQPVSKPLEGSHAAR